MPIEGLGVKLRVERARLRLSQKEVGKIIGVNESSVSLYERDEVIPPGEVMIKICDLFNCSSDFLYGRERVRNICVDGLPDEGVASLITLTKLLQG